MTKVFGVDISKWQAGIDMSKVKAEGAQFVILRGAYSCPDVVSGGGTVTSPCRTAFIICSQMKMPF